jgi:hypothetical protein
MDGSTGVKKGHIDIGGTKQGNAADHPDWSPDGTKIVFTKIGADSSTLQRMYQGSIQMVTKNGAGWSAAATIVPKGPEGTNRYYPAFTPDSAFVTYDESKCSDGKNGNDCNADTDPSATMYIIKAQTGATPIPLTRANAAGRKDTDSKLTNTYPKWSPFVFKRTGESGSKLMWVTFSSTRHFGLRPPPPPGPASSSGNNEGTYLWMAAIDPDAAASGHDPSFPAFYLPFQDVATSNHIAQWTQFIGPRIP